MTFDPVARGPRLADASTAAAHLTLSNLLITPTPDRGPHVQQGPPQGSSPSSATGETMPSTASAACVAALGGAIARGDQEALATLYRSRIGLVVRLARRWTGRDESFALDVVQETFVRVIGHRASMSRLHSEADVDAWLTALARSATIDLIRRELRAAKRAGPRAGTDIQPHPVGTDIARLDELHRTLLAMDEADQTALRLRSGGATLSQIAQILGTTVGSVHGRIRRAIHAASRNHRENNHE